MDNPLPTTSSRFHLPDDIVARLRAREEHAYREVVEACFTRLARFSFRIVGSYDLAEDIVQGVLVKISELGEDFNPRGSLAAYLYTAVRSRSLDALRKEGRDNRLQAELKEDITLDDESTSNITFSDINEFMSLLTERQRTAVQLRFLEHCTVPEIAEILGVSVTSTNRLLSRAIKTLKERYRP